MLFKYCHEILAFTLVWQKQTLPAFPVVLIPERNVFSRGDRISGIKIPVACSYFFIIIVRGILDYTQDYKSKDPWLKSTYSRKVNVLPLHNAVLC